MAELSIPARAQGAVAGKRAHRGFEVPRLRTSVLVIGGGPTGATLALGLGRRGVCTVLVDASEQPLPGVRAGGASSRTMEVMRAIGVADDIRARAPIRPGWPRTSVITTGLRRTVLDIRGPRSRAGEATQPAAVTPEVFQNVPSFVLESVIREHIARCPQVTTLYGRRFVGDLEQTGTEVTARFVDNDGFPVEVTADYAVATDGANSIVRDFLGVPLHGHRRFQTRYTIEFVAPGFGDAHGLGRHNQYAVHNGDMLGYFLHQDMGNRWTLQIEELSPGLRPRLDQPADIVRTALGGPVGIEWAAARQWQANAFYAGKARVGRIFLAGDAAHAGPPGHLGLQQGVTDAADLSWKLAAAVAGWGGERLLDSYER